MWTKPRPAIVCLLLVDLAVAGWALIAVAQATVAASDVLVAAVLAVCATAHMVATREPEERRRAAHSGGEHVDQSSVWVFTAAIALPVPLVLGVLILIRVQRYLIARKPPHTFVYTTAAIAASALSVHAVAGVTPLRDWVTGQQPMPTSAASALALAGALVAAVAAYFLAQAVLIGAARGMVTGGWSLSGVLGGRKTNEFILTTLLLAVCATALQAASVVLTLLLVPVAIRSTRTEQGLRQALADRDQLRADALHDPLTGLLNRRGFNPAASLTMATDESNHRPSSLLFADLDHFKAWNTRLGHIGADQVLVAVANTLRQHTRLGDLVCRWGGEEMAILLPNTDPDEAVAMAERLRLAVSALEVEVSKPAGGQPLRLHHDGLPGCTVSFGVATAPHHGHELDGLEECADQALEQAKKTGRNKVVAAGVDPSVTVSDPHQADSLTSH